MIEKQRAKKSEFSRAQKKLGPKVHSAMEQSRLFKSFQVIVERRFDFVVYGGDVVCL